MVKRRVNRSAAFHSFNTAKSSVRIGGPDRTFKPELPKRPIGAGGVHRGAVAGQPGTTNALVSNQRLTLFPDDRLPSAMRSGRPPIVPVPEGSYPAKDGAKYWPVCNTPVKLRRQP